MIASGMAGQPVLDGRGRYGLANQRFDLGVNVSHPHRLDSLTQDPHNGLWDQAVS
jgi:hypothetical protein